MSQSNQAYLFALCASLTEKGITPTLGTIRNRADRTLAIPEIINVLKMWKENPQQSVPDDASQTDSKTSAEIPLEKRVEQLEATLANLSAKLQSFIDDQK